MAVMAVRFREGDRVTVADPGEPYDGHTGEVVDWYFGMSGLPVMFVRVDGEDQALRFTQDQLADEGS